MTPFLILCVIGAACLIAAGLYIRWDYLQDRKDVWDWEAYEDDDEYGFPYDSQAAMDAAVGTPEQPPASRLKAALADADDALHWRAPGTSRRIAGATRVLVDSVGVALVRMTEPDELHWRAA